MAIFHTEIAKEAVCTNQKESHVKSALCSFEHVNNVMQKDKGAF